MVDPSERLRRLILGCLNTNLAFVRRQLDRGADVNGVAIVVVVGDRRFVFTPLYAVVRSAADRSGAQREEALQVVSLLLARGASVRLSGMLSGEFSRQTDVVSVALRNNDAELARVLLQPRGDAADAAHYGELAIAGRLFMDAAQSCPDVLPDMMAPGAMTAACTTGPMLTAVVKAARLHGTASDTFARSLDSLCATHTARSLAVSWKLVVWRQLDEPLNAHAAIIERLAAVGAARLVLNQLSLVATDDMGTLACPRALDTLIGVGATGALVTRLQAAGLVHSYTATRAAAALPRLFAAIASRVDDPACITSVLQPLTPAERADAVNLRDDLGQTPLIRAICIGAPLSIVDALLAAGARVVDHAGGGDALQHEDPTRVCYVRIFSEFGKGFEDAVSPDRYFTHAWVQGVTSALDAVPAVVQAYQRTFYLPRFQINLTVPLDSYACHPRLARTLHRMLQHVTINDAAALSRPFAARLLSGVLSVPSSAPPALLYNLVLLLLPHVHEDDILAVDDECNSPMSAVLRLCQFKMRSYLPLLRLLFDRYRNLGALPGWTCVVNASKLHPLPSAPVPSSLTSTGVLLSSIFDGKLQPAGDCEQEDEDNDDQASTHALVLDLCHSLYYDLADLSQRNWVEDAAEEIAHASTAISMVDVARALCNVLASTPTPEVPCDCGLCSAPLTRQRTHTALVSILCDAGTDTKVRYTDSAAGSDAYGLASVHAPLLYHAALTFDAPRRASAYYAAFQLLWSNALFAAVDSKDAVLFAALLHAMLARARAIDMLPDVVLGIYTSLKSAWLEPAYDPAMVRCHVSADFARFVRDVSDPKAREVIDLFVSGGAVTKCVHDAQFVCARALLEAGAECGRLLDALYRALADRRQLRELLPSQSWDPLDGNALTRNAAALVRVLGAGAWARRKHVLAARQRLRRAAWDAALPDAPRGLRRPREVAAAEEEEEGVMAVDVAEGAAGGAVDDGAVEPAARSART
jgi:hypothetical protein